MTFPPIKADRCLLWITLHPDADVKTRYAALRAVLKQCHLHPLDTTPTAEVVIVEEAALDAHLAEVRAVLGEHDMLHKITKRGDRLYVNVIASPGVMADDLARRPADRRPAWLSDD
jgi:hypothetical protein